MVNTNLDAVTLNKLLNGDALVSPYAPVFVEQTKGDELIRYGVKEVIYNDETEELIIEIKEN